MMVDSVSKTPISADIAAAIVARAMPGRQLSGLTECTEGWFNAVHRLELDDGSTCVVKVAPPPGVTVLRYERDLITTEVDALRRLEHVDGVPVPQVLFVDDSTEIVASPYFVMSEAAGTLLPTLRGDLDPEANAGIDAQLARIVARINGVRNDRFGRPEATAPLFGSWADAFTRLIDDLLADAADADVVLPAGADAFHSLVERHHGDLDEVTEPCLVDWDLWDPNVFVDPSTLEVTGVIDFERVLWADPLMEAQFTGKRGSDPVVEAYGTPLFDPPGAVARRQLYDLYLYLVMVVECAYRNYPTSDIEDLGRAMLSLTLDELGSPEGTPGRG